jgi:VanZ family protein
MLTTKSTFFLGRWSVLVLFVVINYLAFTTAGTPVVDGWNDKFKHILAFASLAFGLVYFWRLSHLQALVLLLCYGVLIEVVQSFIPGRYPSVLDVLADSLGIALGIAGALMVERQLGRPLKDR